MDIDRVQPPIPLTGAVTAVPQADLVEISFGSNKGLRKGQTLDVTRESSYVGRIEVMATTPERAACRVDPKMLRKPIERGDRVQLEASSQNNAEQPTVYRKPRADVFTMLPIIALLAILLGIGLLWAHMKSVYDWKMKGGPNPTMAPSATAVCWDARANQSIANCKL